LLPGTHVYAIYEPGHEADILLRLLSLLSYRTPKCCFFETSVSDSWNAVYGSMDLWKHANGSSCWFHDQTVSESRLKAVHRGVEEERTSAAATCNDGGAVGIGDVLVDRWGFRRQAMRD
jgi:hypothetical protein